MGLAASTSRQAGIATFFTVLVMPFSAMADSFTFSTGDVTNLIATTSQPSGPGIETETGDDFVLTQPTSITHADFTGLIPSGSNITNVVIEVYRVFPNDSNVNRTSGPPTFSTSQVPTRVNSPSDVEFDGRSAAMGTLTFVPKLLNSSFTANSSVQVGGIKLMGGSDGSVSGQEVQFSVDFVEPFTLPADHYFFVPQVSLSTGQFLWLSGTRPITAPDGTPFPPGFADLQAWIRDANFDPDWMRVGTDIIGGGATFNMAFDLNGVTVPGPIAGAGVPGLIFGAGGLLAWWRRRRNLAA